MAVATPILAIRGEEDFEKNKKYSLLYSPSSGDCWLLAVDRRKAICTYCAHDSKKAPGKK
jgi:hypothetical protein